MRSLKTFFKGGVHPQEHKEATAHSPIEEFKNPRRVTIHLSQHLGEPSMATVKRGDIVKRGQVVGDAQGNGVPVHSSIYGKVFQVTKAPHASLVESQAVIIDALPAPEDGSPTSLDFVEDLQWRGLSKSQMLERIKKAGIVGLGGAAFPTFRKLSLPENAKIDTLILNGAECEPYLTSDHRMMLEESEAMIEGAWLIANIIGVRRCIIGIEDNKMDAVRKLRDEIARLHPETWSPPVEFQVEATHTRYPQGSEKQLIQALTGRNVPARKLPLDIGVIVQNVATAIACLKAIRYQMPLLDRVVTVSGAGIKTPKNIRAPLGTALDEIVNACGGMNEGVVKILAGGPMMGRTIPSLEIPLIKGTNGLLMLTASETYIGSFESCIQCAECLNVCPLGLEPNRISVMVEAGRPLETENFGTNECFECGCCSYACPSHRPLVQFIQVAKSAYRKQAQIMKGAAAHG